MDKIPKIKCFWGFRCAFCVNDLLYKYPLCDRHFHKWDDFHEETKKQIYTYVRMFNKGDTNRRILQIFINKIEIYDELNKRFMCTGRLF